jgi:hypothetical protein
VTSEGESLEEYEEMRRHIAIHTLRNYRRMRTELLRGTVITQTPLSYHPAGFVGHQSELLICYGKGEGIVHDQVASGVHHRSRNRIYTQH